MLVLSRRRDETIMIGDEIEITVVDIRGDKVRLGITAPTRIAVHRKEVYESDQGGEPPGRPGHHTGRSHRCSTHPSRPVRPRPSTHPRPRVWRQARHVRRT